MNDWSYKVADRRRRLRLWHKANPGKKLRRFAELKEDGTRPVLVEIMERAIKRSQQAMIKSLTAPCNLYDRLKK